MVVLKELKYTNTHEWIKLEGDIVRIGITDYAQEELGEVVYVELLDPNGYIEQMSQIGVIESVKSVSELYAPLSGKVIEVNQDLLSQPQLINQDPYGKGWILTLKVDLKEDIHEFDHLIDAKEYQDQFGGSIEKAD